MSIADFKNRHAGESCAILANGETVRDFPAADWQHPIIGLNRSWELVQAPYYCIIDVEQLMAAADHGVEFKHLFVGMNDGKDGKYKPEREARKLAVLDAIKAESVTILAGQERRYGLGFCMDLERDKFYIPNVSYMALQLARYMGFAEMHFWGLDLHGAKFWRKDWEIGDGPAKQQNRQFKYAWRVLKPLGVRVVNHSAGTLCTVFERK